MNFISMRPLTAPPCRNLEENSNCSVAGVDITVAFQHGDVAALRDDDDVAHGEVETAANATAVSEHTRKELAATTSSGSSKSLADYPRKKKRVCKISGCSRSVKAQGHCQKHGAKIKRCKAPGCNSQAQGSHEGYCKRHWQERLDPEDPRKKTKKKKEEEQTACEPFGSSVYDYIVPASFAWKTEMSGRVKSPIKEDALEGGGMADQEDKHIELIPILKHLVENESLDPGWHRTNERLARGIHPPKSLSTQLESWEKQLAVLEMALIAGTDTAKCLTQHKTSKVLAHAWGREKGFHKIMIEKHCSRRGELDRKKRVDAGVPIPEKRAAYKIKHEATKEVK